MTTTLDGLRIDPLYTTDDVDPACASTYPDQAPYVRGTHALGHRSFGWDVRQQVSVDHDPVRCAELALTELERGATQLLLDVTTEDVTAELLDGVYLDLVAVALDVGDRAIAKADALIGQPYCEGLS